MSDIKKIETVNIPEETKKNGVGKRPVDREDVRRMGNVIRKYRTLAKLEQKQVAAVLGVSSTAIGNWELGLTRPSLELVGPLCEYLNIPMDEFLNVDPMTMLPLEDKRALSNYHELTPFNRETVNQLVERLLFLQDMEVKARLRRHFTTIPIWEPSAAADIDSLLPEYEEKHETYVRVDSIPYGADCIIRVNGAGMKPKFPHGCHVYVDTSAEVHEGDVGIFVVDGQSYIKELRPEGLHSYNPCYKTIRILESTDWRCFGKVVGIVKDGDIPDADGQNRIMEAYEDH